MFSRHRAALRRRRHSIFELLHHLGLAPVAAIEVARAAIPAPGVSSYRPAIVSRRRVRRAVLHFARTGGVVNRRRRHERTRDLFLTIWGMTPTQYFGPDEDEPGPRPRSDPNAA